MPDLSALPLPIAMMVIAIWVVNQNNIANTKQIVALMDAFDKQYSALVKGYEMLIQAAFEDRQESRQRWIERDRLLNERLERATVELTQNRAETHALRNVMQVVATTIEQIAREILPARSTRRGGSKPGDAND